MGILSGLFKRGASRAARKEALRRAEEIGFDTSRVLYHGTNRDRAIITPSRGGLSGDGVYLTDHPGTANVYATKHGLEGANIVPVFARKMREVPAYMDQGKTFIVDDPADIRSIFAAFDPAKRSSRDLLAGLGIGAVTGGGLLSRARDRQSA
jgi:hypothetical protein